MSESILVTGAGGFIGYHLAESLLRAGESVTGIDNMNDYYSPDLKWGRIERLRRHAKFLFVRGDICDDRFVTEVFDSVQPSFVINLAAQAGVRYSLENPSAYIQSNLVGFGNIVEAARRHNVQHLLYASSSSVYGSNTKTPFLETDPVDHPMSLYAATKRSNELMAESYSHLYDLRMSGLRFFTVYGPWGRPDMAYFGFSEAWRQGQPIRIYSNPGEMGSLFRDFTYVSDVVESVQRLIRHRGEGVMPHEIYNVGGSDPVTLEDFVVTLEKSLGQATGCSVSLQKVYEGRKAGDVTGTYADTNKLSRAVGYRPSTSLASGLKEFADWYVNYAGLVALHNREG